MSNVKSMSILLWVSLHIMFQYGYSIYYPNVAFSTFSVWLNESSLAQFNHELTHNQFTWFWSLIVNIFMIGLIVGCCFCSAVADRWGRKAGFAVGTLLELVGVIVAVLGIHRHSPLLLLVGRLFTGLGSGVTNPCLSMYLQDSAPVKIRGLAASFQEISLLLGGLLAMVIGTEHILGDNIFWLVAVAAAPALSLLLTLCFIHDSPKFLLLTKKNEIACRESVAFYHPKGTDIEEIVASIRAESYSTESLALRDLFTTQSLRMPVFLGCVCFGIQQFTGIFAKTYFSTDLLMRIGLTRSKAEFSSCLMVLGNVLVTLGSLLIVDRVGRRVLLLVGAVWCALLLAAFVVFSMIDSNWANIASAVAFVVHSIGFSMGPGPIPWFVSGELVPLEARGMVLSIAHFFNASLSVSLSLIFLSLYSSIGAWCFFPLYIVPLLASAIFLYFKLPETKGALQFDKKPEKGLASKLI